MQLLKWTKTQHSDLLLACCAALHSGGILAYPTDTLYGLGVDATNPEAVEALNRLKGRQNAPISVLVDSVAALKTYLKNPSPKLIELMETFMPGPVTVIAKTDYPFAPQLLGPGNSVGFRVVDHDFCTRLIQQYGKPITTTSVNPTGKPAANDIDRIREYFPSELDVIVDDGPFGPSPGSTVINTNTRPWKILREGVVALNDLKEYLS